MMKFAAVILCEDLSKLGAQLEVARKEAADIVEIRFDLIEEINIQSLHSTIKAQSLPVILSIRSVGFGGSFRHSENNRVSRLKDLISAEPDYIDLEYPYDMHLLDLPIKSKVIISMYDMEGLTKIDFETGMRIVGELPGGVFRIVCQPNIFADLKTIWQWAGVLKRRNIPHLLTGIGDLGQITRIKAKDLGNLFAYGLISETPKSLMEYGRLHLNVIRRGNAEGSIHIGQIGSSRFQYHSRAIRRMLKLQDKKGVILNMKIENELELMSLLNWMKDGIIDALLVEDEWQITVMDLLDDIDLSAAHSKQCSLIITRNGRLLGFDLNYLAVKKILEENTRLGYRSLYAEGINSVTYGALGYSAEQGMISVVRNRTELKVDQLREIFPRVYKVYDGIIEEFDVLVNAVPFGRKGLPNMIPVPLSKLPDFEIVIDTILLDHPTPLEKQKDKYTFKYYSGFDVLYLKMIFLNFILFGKQLESNIFEKNYLLRGSSHR